MDTKFPTWKEIYQMREDKDKISLVIVHTDASLVGLSLAFRIIALIGSQWEFSIEVVDSLKTGSNACLLIAAGIGFVVFPLKRADFIYKKKKCREATIAQKAEHIKETFKKWLADKYMDGALKTETENHQRFHRDKKTVADMRIGDKYEVPWLLEVSFDDLEDIYPKNEADKDIDGEIRKRVFDDLEFSNILEVQEKHTAYTFWNTGKHPEMFKRFMVDHWDILY